jgi:hypothetical protein
MRQVLKRASVPGKVESVSFVDVKMPPVATSPAARAKVTGDLLDRDGIFNAQVEFQSGERGKFAGTKEQLATLVNEGSVKKVVPDTERMVAPDISRVSVDARQAGYDPVQARMSVLPDGTSTTTKGSDLSGMTIYHGTVNQFEDSVRAGPRDIGKGYGGSGLYLAMKGERELASDYANYAMKQYHDRIREHGIKANTSVEAKPIVLQGAINPDKDLKVGVFNVQRDGVTDLSRGILGGPDWADDPLVKRTLESQFDILDLRGASTSGAAGLSDRFLVVHQRAGKDAILWTDSSSTP